MATKNPSEEGLTEWPVRSSYFLLEMLVCSNHTTSSSVMMPVRLAPAPTKPLTTDCRLPMTLRLAAGPKTT